MFWRADSPGRASHVACHPALVTEEPLGWVVLSGEDNRNACYMGIRRLAESLYSGDETVKWDAP